MGIRSSNSNAMIISGMLFFLAAAIVFMGIITAEMFYPAGYSTGHNEISDLGATRPPNSIIAEPSATIFDNVMRAAGIMILVGTFFVFRAYGDLLAAVPMGLLGLGALGVGVFSGNVVPMHPLFALLTFVGGGLAAICSYRIIRSPFRYIVVLLGVTTLFFLVTNEYFGTVLGTGGVERWIAYPVVLWLLGMGGYLIGVGSSEIK
ncbi:MAG TPA: DUF998 domain-containing protein [Methanocella sp.]|nr:DUF998 domain-containing protein [Methanocella sp.]